MRHQLKILSSSKYTFEGQKPDEHTEIILRSHWLFILGYALIFLFLLVIPFGVYYTFLDFLVTYELGAAFWFLAALYFILVWYAMFYRVVMYLLNIWIITDHRIIDTKQHGLFDRKVAELHISKIQDVSVKVDGFIETFLDFGDIEVQTAGIEQHFQFRNVPNPVQVKNLIMETADRYRKSHPGGTEPENV